MSPAPPVPAAGAAEGPSAALDAVLRTRVEQWIADDPDPAARAALENLREQADAGDEAAAEATSFTRWWVQECLERLPRFVFPDPLFERVLAAYHARGFREAALRAMLEQ